MAQDRNDPVAPGTGATGTGSTAEERFPRRHSRPVRKTDAASTTTLPPHERKAGPGEFVSQSADELKKVVWPTRPQMASYFVAVLVFVAFIMVLVSLLDTGLGWLVLTIFGE